MALHEARDDVVALDHPALGRAANLTATFAPLALLGFAVWRAWGGALHWQDLVVLATGYVLTGMGVTVGFHRLFTHRSFKTRPPIRALFAVLGSAAVEGPLIEWVSTHRMHHRFSDRPGDPHSPHVDRAAGWRGAFRGLLHAHVGWIFRATGSASPARYAPDLLADPLTRWVDRTFPLWVLAGLAAPFGLGVALSGTIAGGITRPSRSTRSATSSAGAASRPATTRATSHGSRSRPSVRRGITTIMLSPPPPAMGSRAGNSIRAAG
jgi:stearoyl-CoA desaturase (Delta-9 desaturase)